MKQLKAAALALDMEKAESLTQAYDKMEMNSQKTFKKLSVKFVEESKLTKLGEKLQKLNGQIDTKTAEL